MLELVMRRMAEREHPVGLTFGMKFSLGSGKPGRSVLIHNMPRAKDRKEEFAGTTYAPVKFCPFCGKERDGFRERNK